MKLQVFANFWLPMKCYNPLSDPPPRNLQIYPPPEYFLFPKMKMKLNGLQFADVAEIQEAVTDDLKESKKRNFRQVFRNCTTAQNLLICQWSLFRMKNLRVFLTCLRFFKKIISPKTFEPHCV